MFIIKSVEAIAPKIPFGDFYDGPRSAPRNWTHFETVLVRVESADGAVGWGESFAYGCASAVRAAATDMVAPLAVGRSVQDIAALNRELQRRLHIQGRYTRTYRYRSQGRSPFPSSRTSGSPPMTPCSTAIVFPERHP